MQPSRNNENPSQNTKPNPFKFKADFPRSIHPEAQRVFGTEITNLSKPLKQLKRTKTNSITTIQPQPQLVNPRTNPVGTNVHSLEDNMKGSCQFHSQQVPSKIIKMEEEFISGLESERWLGGENVQYVGVYVNEISHYLRDIEVLYFFWKYGVEGGYGGSKNRF